MIKKILENHEIKRIHFFIFIFIILFIIFLIKVLFNYLDYSLYRMTPFHYGGYGLHCVQYVAENTPTLSEYQESEWKNEITPIILNNETVYIACLNITYTDYPSYLKSKFKAPKEYTLQEALEKNIITFIEFEKYFNEHVLIDVEGKDYKITDLIIFDK